MRLEELECWRESFEAIHGRFAHLFARSESREQAAKYLRGLLAPVERKNAWQVAEAVGDATPDRTQRLLYRVEWDADAARDILQDFVVETLAHPDGIGVLDESGFIKKGSHSAGVQRQYSGTAGKVENCQLGVFLTYSSPRGHAFLDRRLYLPESWCQDMTRRTAAQIPQDVVFQTKPAQGLAMLKHAWDRGAPMRWVIGDEVYGENPQLREAIERQGCGYILAVSSITPVWTERPAIEGPTHTSRGRPRTKMRLAPTAPPSTTVAAVVASWPAEQWQRFSMAEGEKGPRVYDWAWARVIESRQQLPGPEVWLLVRRSVNDAPELAYYLVLAPWETTLQEAAAVAATRYTVEQCIAEAKGETGLDHYEVRHWGSWYRHITLSMLAHAWLAAVRSAEVAKRGR